jgi:hypothetical protein
MKIEQINTLDFKGQNIYVGIDIHLKSWSVTVSVRKFSVEEVQVRSATGSITQVSGY